MHNSFTLASKLKQVSKKNVLEYGHGVIESKFDVCLLLISWVVMSSNLTT